MSNLFQTVERNLLQECIHCGLCLPSCPTYLELGKETDSPRGRLALMNALEHGQLNGHESRAFEHLDLCLGCLACEDNCPSGVRYGHLLESARSYQYANGSRPAIVELLFLAIIASPVYLNILTTTLRLLQITRLDKLLRAFPLLPRALRQQLAGLPQIPKKSLTQSAGGAHPQVAPDGKPRGRVTIFTGCVMDKWYAQIHAATMRVLRWNGFEVVIPEGDHCCGALHSHSGDQKTAQSLLRNSRAIYETMAVDAIILNSAGCGAQLLQHDWATNDTAPTMDITEFLAARLSHPPMLRLEDTVTYDAPCHLHYAQGIKSDPLELLNVSCQNLVQSAEAEVCCGSAGIYSITQGRTSQQLLDRKIGNILASTPQRLATANPGCHMQLQAGLRSAGQTIPVEHVIQIVDHAYRLDPAYRKAFQIN